MKKLFKIGDEKKFSRVVTADDFAAFHGQLVHRVCSTFSLSRDFEWTTRLFVLDECDEDEEGLGTFVHIDHHAPAFEGEVINFIGRIEEINGNEFICSVSAYVNDKLVATGRTGQKIFKKEKIRQLFTDR